MVSTILTGLAPHSNGWFTLCEYSKIQMQWVIFSFLLTKALILHFEVIKDIKTSKCLWYGRISSQSLHIIGIMTVDCNKRLWLWKRLWFVQMPDSGNILKVATLLCTFYKRLCHVIYDQYRVHGFHWQANSFARISLSLLTDASLPLEWTNMKRSAGIDRRQIKDWRLSD